MVKRKVVSLFFVIVLLISITACNGTSQQAVNQEEVSSNGNEVVEEEDINWPNDTIQIIVPYNPGGDTDFNARAYAEQLEPILGVPVVVTNISGNGGAAGNLQAKNSPNDGNTILFYHVSMFVNEATEATDFGLDGFELAAIGGKNAGNVVCVSGDSPYNSLGDLIEVSKENPDELAFAANPGASTYVMGTLLNEAGAELNLVDMGGTSDRIAALLGGHVTAIPNTLGSTIPYLESGDFKALAILENERSESYPDIPTAIEQGYDAALPIYYFFAFPKGTDEEKIEKFVDAVEKVSQTEEYAKKIKDAFKQDVFFARKESAYEILSKQESEIMNLKDLLMN